MPPGIFYALASAVLFGVSTPLAKLLVGNVPPLMLAGLLYIGSGVGLMLVLVARWLKAAHGFTVAMPSRVEWRWFGAAIFFGGMLAPVALMYGLVSTPAATASLLLNLEAVFTAMLAWFYFRESFDRRILLGMLAIIAGGIVLAWSATGTGGVSGGSLLIAAACLCWALDNNLTRRASAADALVIASFKGLIAGIANLALALLLGQRLPSFGAFSGALIVGFFGYGVSLVLFVLALRHLGSARAGAYFAIAPFFGAMVAVAVQGERLTMQLEVAGALMALGVWLHVRERHQHAHLHDRQEHTHAHAHDEHHRHAHDFVWDGQEPHTHAHVHSPIVHAHPHYPDVHHRHVH